MQQELKTTCPPCGAVFTIYVEVPIVTDIALGNCPACESWKAVVRAVKAIAEQRYESDRIRGTVLATSLQEAMAEYQEIANAA